MRDPGKLRVFGAAEELAVAAYRATARFPSSERFGLTAQLRRSAVSIGSNIAEGCHRQGSRALLSFLHNALGSAGELHFQIGLAMRLDLGDTEELRAVLTTTMACKKMLAKLIVRVRRDTN